MNKEEIELKNPCYTGKCNGFIEPDCCECDWYKQYRSDLIQFNKLKAEITKLKEDKKQMIESLGEDLIEPIVNFYIPSEQNKIFAFDLLKQFKERWLK